jgi:methyl-accepting chemotaxis protein
MRTGRRHVSLAFTLTVYTALVIAAGMGVYAVHQYLSNPGETVLGLALRHSSHVIGLGVMVYLALSAVLYRKMVRPMQDLNVKLYAISRGDFTPLAVDPGISEIRQVALVINFLLHEMKRAVPEGLVEELSDNSQRLRALAGSAESLSSADRDDLVEVAGQIDGLCRRLSASMLRRDEEEADEAESGAHTAFAPRPAHSSG